MKKQIIFPIFFSSVLILFFGCDNKEATKINDAGVVAAQSGDYAKAKELYEKSCSLNNGLGCSNLGGIYADGQGVPKDYFKAKEYFEKACNYDAGIGCSNLGYLYEKGQGVPQNYGEAKKFYKKACELKWQRGCENYARLNSSGK